MYAFNLSFTVSKNRPLTRLAIIIDKTFTSKIRVTLPSPKIEAPLKPGSLPDKALIP